MLLVVLFVSLMSLLLCRLAWCGTCRVVWSGGTMIAPAGSAV